MAIINLRGNRLGRRLVHMYQDYSGSTQNTKSLLKISLREDVCNNPSHDHIPLLVGVVNPTSIHKCIRITDYVAYQSSHSHAIVFLSYGIILCSDLKLVWFHDQDFVDRGNDLLLYGNVLFFSSK